MSRIAYVNGRYLPMRNATVHVEDRGYQFGDGKPGPVATALRREFHRYAESGCA